MNLYCICYSDLLSSAASFLQLPQREFQQPGQQFQLLQLALLLCSCCGVAFLNSFLAGSAVSLSSGTSSFCSSTVGLLLSNCFLSRGCSLSSLLPSSAFLQLFSISASSSGLLLFVSAVLPVAPCGVASSAGLPQQAPLTADSAVSASGASSLQYHLFQHFPFQQQRLLLLALLLAQQLSYVLYRLLFLQQLQRYVPFRVGVNFFLQDFVFTFFSLTHAINFIHVVFSWTPLFRPLISGF